MQRKWAKWFVGFLAAILILSVVAVGCGPEAPEVTKDKIKIGFSAPISGWASVAVDTIMNPYVMWSEKVNEEGGLYIKDIDKRLPIELVYYDDKSSADEVVKIYERLITVDKVDLLLSPWGTWAIFPLLSLIEKYKVPFVAATEGTEEILGVEASYYWTHAYTKGWATGPSIAGLLSTNKAKVGTKVAYMGLIYPALLDFKKAFIPAAEDAGFDIVLDKDYPLEVTDLSEVLLQVKSLNVDALIVGSITADMILIIKQSREIGLDPKCLYFFVGPGVTGFFDMYGDAAEGILGLSFWDRYGPGPGSTEFFDWYVERWGTTPDMTDVPMHQAPIQVLEQAIEKAGTLDWEEINNTIATEEFMTIMGPIRFDDDQIARTGIFGTSGIGQVQNGETRLVWPPEYASSEYQHPKPSWPSG
ncbi:amino acid ABC transporter substrate-binding protein [Chloroflexota bacterium]